MRPSTENLTNALYEDLAEQRWDAEQRGHPAGDLTHRLDNLETYLNGQGPLLPEAAAALHDMAYAQAHDAHDTAVQDSDAARVLAEAGNTKWARVAATSARREATRARTAATSAREFATFAPAGAPAHAATTEAEQAAVDAESAAFDAESAAHQAEWAARAAERSIA